MTTELNDKQVDVLRSLYREGPASSVHVDGRVARALLSRGFVAEAGGWISLTSEGRKEFERIRRRRIASGGESASGRADSIVRAAESLGLALPAGAEIMVGDMPASATDVIAGLIACARALERDLRHG
ncbi:MAG TPA: hypothetical protein VFS20_16310 [Longimicrobium sp.]|nr:hypothetical protein [Longimicrobium sp.]